jgi:hypothetical protein
MIRPTTMGLAVWGDGLAMLAAGDYLDAINEAMLAQIIAEITEERVLLVIAHRMSTVHIRTEPEACPWDGNRQPAAGALGGPAVRAPTARGGSPRSRPDAARTMRA